METLKLAVQFASRKPQRPHPSTQRRSQRDGGGWNRNQRAAGPATEELAGVLVAGRRAEEGRSFREAAGPHA